VNKYGAKKTTCVHGHKHDSRREAARCAELHLLQRAGHISALHIHPLYRFSINHVPIKMGNGGQASYTPDFYYIENGKMIVEDVKGFIVRDFPLRAALFRALYPDVELRVTK
jgi:Protein of unknown function (DUF1064)